MPPIFNKACWSFGFQFPFYKGGLRVCSFYVFPALVFYVANIRKAYGTILTRSPDFSLSMLTRQALLAFIAKYSSLQKRIYYKQQNTCLWFGVRQPTKVFLFFFFVFFPFSLCWTQILSSLISAYEHWAQSSTAISETDGCKLAWLLPGRVECSSKCTPHWKIEG